MPLEQFAVPETNGVRSPLQLQSAPYFPLGQEYATPKKMGRLNKMIAFNVLIVVMIWIYDFLVTLGESADGPLFEGVFGLIQIHFHTSNKNRPLNL